jgi:hypothetical protein
MMKRKMSVIVPLAVLAGTLSGCGSGAASSSGTVPSSAATDQATAAATHAKAVPSAALVYHFVTAASIGPYRYSAEFSYRMAHDATTAGGESDFAACLRKDGLDSAGSIASVSYQDYQNSFSASEGLSVIGFQGTFRGDAASALYQADDRCGSGPTGAARAAPGPDGGTLYTYTDKSVFSNLLPACTWSTSSTVAVVTFFDTATLRGASLAAACRIVRASIETR